MNNFILFILATIGLTNILVDSRLFEPVRNWLQRWLPTRMYEIFECYQCCGFWVGLVCGLLLSYNPFVLFLCGCASSFLASFAHVVTEWFISKTEFLINE